MHQSYEPMICHTPLSIWGVVSYGTMEAVTKDFVIKCQKWPTNKGWKAMQRIYKREFRCVSQEEL